MPLNATRLGRQRTPFRIKATPIISVMLASLATALPIVAQSPILPPFGLMLFLAWRLLRPELWPVWIGLPLGAFDDLASGQPLGTGMVLWTLILLGIELDSRRHLFRDYLQDWLIAAVAIAVWLVGGGLIVRLSGHGGPVVQLLPQIGYSILLFPLVVRVCATLDRWRLP
ncbi:rod shape-determining protein MreD [Sphingobium sp. CR28]|uniref:rod shape-determining protein MreD n=1 Tax=Sphingobium sp. CR28 TaxID=3400272 RepID=UPI003FEE5BC8